MSRKMSIKRMCLQGTKPIRGYTHECREIGGRLDTDYNLQKRFLWEDGIDLIMRSFYFWSCYQSPPC